MNFLSVTYRYSPSLCRISNLNKSLCRYALRKEITVRNYSELFRSTIKSKIPARRSRGFATCNQRLSNPGENASNDVLNFEDLGNKNILHPDLIKTLTDDLSFDKMMPIQAVTADDLIAKRHDVMAQARTGTGKTIAFLLPAIQTLITKDRQAGAQISALIISPTRELTLQIAKEAKQLLKRFPNYRVRTAIGGVNKTKEEKLILAGTDILIATPGRLLDHMKNSQNVLEKFQSLDTLVLDEADRLLDMGFMEDIKRIVNYLPDKKTCKTQGMLFSATIAPHVEKVANLVLAKNYKSVSTIPAGEKLTHEHVIQKLITVPSFAEVVPALVGYLQAEMKENGSEKLKSIIFVPTAASANLYGAILEQIPELSSIKFSTLHSRASQGKRNRVTKEFRAAKSASLIATDIVARGIDIPDITHVIQVGVPQEKQSYIHRLGRTARAGAGGQGAFIITEAERFFVSKKIPEIKFESCPADVSSQEKVFETTKFLGSDMHKKSYQAWIGYYKVHMKDMGWTARNLIDEAAVYAKTALGALETPKLTKKVIAMMGFRGMQGLVTEPDASQRRREKQRTEKLSEQCEEQLNSSQNET